MLNNNVSRMAKKKRKVKKSDKCQRIDDKLFYKHVSLCLIGFIENIEKTNFELYSEVVKDECLELYDKLTDSYTLVEQIRKYIDL